MTGRLITQIGDFDSDTKGYIMANDLRENSSPLDAAKRVLDFVPDFWFRPEGTRQVIGVNRNEVQILA